MSDSEADPSYSVLPARLRRRIDRAFDNTIIEAGHSNHVSEPEPSRKRRKVEQSPTAPGGFIVDDLVPAAGGFVVDDEPAAGDFLPDDAGTRTSESSEDEDVPAHPTHTHIPLSLIPSALQLLDLQPDDEDVLSVFQNAASGWEGRSRAGKDDQVLSVSRKDWRAVCAALLDTSGGDGGDDGGQSGTVTDAAVDKNSEDEDEDEPERLEDSEGSGEEYVDSEEAVSDGEDAEDSDYQDGGFLRSKAKAKVSPNSKGVKRRTRVASDSESSEDVRSIRITARQRAECRKVFALFFPEVSDEDLAFQRIMIKDISRVAAILKEKITAEEVSWFC